MQITRRDVGKMALASLPMAAMGAKINSKIAGVQIGAITYSYRGVLMDWYVQRPAVFWLWTIPYNLAIEGAMIALLFVRSPRANMGLLAALILLLTIPYWVHGAIETLISRAYGY